MDLEGEKDPSGSFDGLTRSVWTSKERRILQDPSMD
jgi:hypothetical protein